MPTPKPPARVALPLVLVMVGLTGVTCGKSDGDNAGDKGTPGNKTTAGQGADYPLISPPVKQATPAAFKDGGNRALFWRRSLLDDAAQNSNVSSDTLDANAFISRFFSAGPTELFNVLGSIDNLISGVNMQSAMGSESCLAQAAIPYDLAVPGGNVTMYAQCYEEVAPEYQGDPGFVQWGLGPNGFYIYSAVGVGWIAAIATANPNGTGDVTADANLVNNSNNAAMDSNAALGANVILNANNYVIHAWYSVGLNNFTVTYQGIDGLGWFNGSYCIAEIFADPQANRFEMTAAGGGIGFCGAQFVSDGNDVFGIGSTDMGSTCNATATVCLDANTGTAQDDCSLNQNDFVLLPIGRQSAVLNANATWAASDYPSGGANNVTLDGNITDSAHFGPGAHDPNAGLFTPPMAGSTTGGGTTGNTNISVNANVSVP